MPGSLMQDITHTIQLSIAPVFLLTALGTTLGVLATRLSRIVDRARRVEARVREEASPQRDASVRELRMLSQRVRLIHWAITSGTTAALLVCLLIAVAFLGYLLEARLATVVAVLFIAAMGAYVGALVCFMREVFLAIATMKFQLPSEATAPGAAEVGSPRAT